MTVAELIEKLQAMPQDATVVTYDHEWGYFIASSPVVERNVEIGNIFTKRKRVSKVVKI